MTWAPHEYGTTNGAGPWTVAQMDGPRVVREHQIRGLLAFYTTLEGAQERADILNGVKPEPKKGKP